MKFGTILLPMNGQIIGICNALYMLLGCAMIGIGKYQNMHWYADIQPIFFYTLVTIINQKLSIVSPSA